MDSVSKKVMLPASGVVKPKHILKVVVLPAPLGPMTPKHSPDEIWKDKSSTTLLVPKLFSKFCTFNK
jgi:hypothetical protein